MPKEILNINDLSKGINSDLSPNDIHDSQVVNAINFLLDKKGRIKPIKGMSEYGIYSSDLDEELKPWIYDQLNGFGAISFRLDYDVYGTKKNTDWIAFQSAINKIIIFDINYPINYLEYTVENGLYNFFFYNGFLYINNKDFSVESSLKKWGFFSNTHFKGISRAKYDNTETVEYEYSSSGFLLLETNFVDFKFIALPHSLKEDVIQGEPHILVNGCVIEWMNSNVDYNNYSVIIRSVGDNQDKCYLSESTIIFDIDFTKVITVGHPYTNTIHDGCISFYQWFSDKVNPDVNPDVFNLISVRPLTNSDNDKFINIQGLTDEQLSGIIFKDGCSYVFDSDNDLSLLHESYFPIDVPMGRKINSVQFNPYEPISFNFKLSFKLSEDRHGIKDLFHGTSNELTEEVFKNSLLFERRVDTSYNIISDNSVAFIESNGNILLGSAEYTDLSLLNFHSDPTNGVSVLLTYEKILNETNPYQKGDYQFIATYLFKDDTDSSPVFSNFPTSIGENESLQINIKLAVNDDFKYNLNAKGIKFYIKNLENGDVFYVGYLDFNNGFKAHNSEKYVSLIPYCELDSLNLKVQALDVNKHIKTGYIDIDRPTVKTFRYETGFDLDDNLNTRFKKAIIANSRLFCVNVKHDEEFSDRMVISPVNKPSILPKNNFIEIASNDGDEYITISKFGAKVLAFKRNYLYIINISSNDPSTFYLESSKFGAGCEYEDAVVSTEFGVFWINSNGIYFYDGERVNNLALNRLENKIKELSSNAKMMTVGYDYIYKKVLFLIKDELDLSTVFVFDIKNNGFINITRETDSPISKDSNFISINGNCCILSDSSIIKYDESLPLNPSQNSDSSFNCVLETKKYDFGQPHVRKKIRRFYAHFIGTVDLPNISFEYRIDDNEYQTITSEIQVSGNLILFDLPSSVTCYTVQLKITGNVTFEINDISIIYRRKLPK